MKDIQKIFDSLPMTQFQRMQDQLNRALSPIPVNMLSFNKLMPAVSQVDLIQKDFQRSMIPFIERFSILNSRLDSPALQQVSQAFETLQKSVSPLSKQMAEIQETMRYPAEQFRLAGESLQKVFDLPVFKSLDSNIFKGVASLNVMNTFTGSTLSQLAELLEDFDETSVQDFLEDFEADVDERVDNLPSNSISAEGIIQVVLAILFFLYSSYSSKLSEQAIIEKIDDSQYHIEQQISKSETRIRQQIGDSEQRILKKIESLIPKEDEAVYYVVLRDVRLRIKPHTKSGVITMLFPNQRVSLIERKSKWIYVSYFDYIESLPKTGWVYKKYLKKLN